jgi:two-component system, NarL family, nitrate/nitrite response regulator NarL
VVVDGYRPGYVMGGVSDVKVLVVTEIRLYRDGVADALGRLDGVDEAVTAANGATAVVSARRSECDVALVDMALPASAQTVRALLAARPSMKVIALGVPEDGPEVVDLAEAGVHGYISRDATLGELLEALKRALSGEAACSGRVAAGLLRYIAEQARSRGYGQVPIQLTPREREVLVLLQAGMTNKEIARALDLRLSTVKNHVHNVLTKHGATGRGQVATIPRRTPLLAASD